MTKNSAKKFQAQLALVAFVMVTCIAVATTTIGAVHYTVDHRGRPIGVELGAYIAPMSGSVSGVEAVDPAGEEDNA